MDNQRRYECLLHTQTEYELWRHMMSADTQWRVECRDSTSNALIYSALFSGQEAEKAACEYSDWMNGGKVTA